MKLLAAKLARNPIPSRTFLVFCSLTPQQSWRGMRSPEFNRDIFFKALKKYSKQGIRISYIYMYLFTLPYIGEKQEKHLCNRHIHYLNGITVNRNKSLLISINHHKSQMSLPTPHVCTDLPHFFSILSLIENPVPQIIGLIHTGCG